jgi:hypothetical protein
LLLRRSALRPGDIVGVSCGRKLDRPMPGSATSDVLKKELEGEPTWRSDYLVSWAGSEAWLRGIVARDPDILKSREARSPGAVYAAFEQFLDDAQRANKTVALVQLLAAGHLKTFESWMSLVQMARAYGRWAQEQHAKGNALLKVVVYLYRDDDVLALMNGGYLDIAENLEDAPMRLFLETIDVTGRVQRQHWMIEASKSLRDVSSFGGLSSSPAIHVLPVPGKGVEPVPFRHIADAPLSSLGLVSGSTLVADYRAASISAAEARASAT